MHVCMCNIISRSGFCDCIERLCTLVQREEWNTYTSRLASRKVNAHLCDSKYYGYRAKREPNNGSIRSGKEEEEGERRSWLYS